MLAASPGRIVSGTPRRPSSTTIISAMCGRYGSAVAAGAHWASVPATRGPSAKPAVIATAARRAIVLWSASPNGGSDVSRSHAVPTPNAAPLPTPASSRPRNSNASAWAPTSRLTLASSDTAAAKIPTGLRPWASDHRPASRSPGINPAA